MKAFILALALAAPLALAEDDAWVPAKHSRTFAAPFTYDRRCKYGVGDRSSWKRGKSSPDKWCDEETIPKKVDDLLEEGQNPIEACPRMVGACEGVGCDSLPDDPGTDEWALKSGEGCAWIGQETEPGVFPNLASCEKKAEDRGGSPEPPKYAHHACRKACCGAWRNENGVDPQASADPDRHRVAWIGDSNVVGRKPAGNKNKDRQEPPYVERLEDLLDGAGIYSESGVEVVNYGQSGTTAITKASEEGNEDSYCFGYFADKELDDGGGGPGRRFDDLESDCAVLGYDTFIWQLGTNDAKFVHKDNRDDAAGGFKAGFLSCVDKVVNGVCGGDRLKRMYFVAPIPIFPESADEGSWRTEGADWTNGQAQTDIAEVTAIALDTYGLQGGLITVAGLDEAEDYDDDVHLKKDGAAKMAAAAFEALKFTPGIGCPTLVAACPEDCPDGVAPEIPCAAAEASVGGCCLGDGVCASDEDTDACAPTDAPTQAPTGSEDVPRLRLRRALTPSPPIFKVAAVPPGCSPCDTTEECTTSGEGTACVFSGARRKPLFGQATTKGCCKGVLAPQPGP